VRIRHRLISILLLTTLAAPGANCLYAQQDIVLTNVYEAAIDLPRIYFLLKRDPTGPPLMPANQFAVNYAFLDTGASGIVLSRETRQAMRIAVHPQARFVDVGVGGFEYFDVSELLSLGVAGYGLQNPQDPRRYLPIGRGRLMIRKGMGEVLTGPLDIIGTPAMVGKVVVLDSAATNALGYFTADIRRPNDPTIPQTHLHVALRLKNFVPGNDPKNVPPLPTTAPNPVIDNIVIYYRDKASRSTWLLDTGGTVSLISVRQAARLGLVKQDGTPLVKPSFSLPLGGIGKMTMAPGYEIDAMVVPTTSGRNLVFRRARLGVHDIAYFDDQKQQMSVLDGVFGSNFLCASAKIEGLLPSDISETVFDKVVIDLDKALMGLRFGRKMQR
jgi:hypothetical protein